MKHRFACDCHSHSNCSFDGRSDMAALCQRAVELGLYYYTVSDHCECNEYKYTGYREIGYRGVVRKAWAEMERCKEQFPKLRFCKGIELGQPLQNLSAARDALSGRDYDFVIGSLHNVAGQRDFYHLGQEGAGPERVESLLSQYFQEILEMIGWGNFDTLAHITYPLRYLPADAELPGFSGHREEVDQVLKALIRADKALELNTSRLGKPGAPKLPDFEIFCRYRELGGRLATLGSDAHCADDLAQGIDLGMELLQEAGFTEFTVFVGRRPVMLPLE